MNVKQVAFVSNDSTAKFHEGVIEWTRDMQAKGLTVEIQYQMSNQLFTALIIGRGV